MDISQILSGANASGVYLLITSAVILMVGITFVHFWGELIVGVGAIFLMIYFFPSLEIEKISPLIADTAKKVSNNLNH